MSAWVKFVTQFYKDKKRGNPNYSFKNAMSEAAKVYKKGAPPKQTKRRRCTRRRRGTRRH